MERPADTLANLAKVIYALHTFSLVTGILGTATIVGAFKGIVKQLTQPLQFVHGLLSRRGKILARKIVFDCEYRWGKVYVPFCFATSHSSWLENFVRIRTPTFGHGAISFSSAYSVLPR